MAGSSPAVCPMMLLPGRALRFTVGMTMNLTSDKRWTPKRFRCVVPKVHPAGLVVRVKITGVVQLAGASDGFAGVDVYDDRTPNPEVFEYDEVHQGDNVAVEIKNTAPLDIPFEGTLIGFESSTD